MTIVKLLMSKLVNVVRRPSSCYKHILLAFCIMTILTFYIADQLNQRTAILKYCSDRNHYHDVNGFENHTLIPMDDANNLANNSSILIDKDLMSGWKRVSNLPGGLDSASNNLPGGKMVHVIVYASFFDPESNDVTILALVPRKVDFDINVYCLQTTGSNDPAESTSRADYSITGDNVQGQKTSSTAIIDPLPEHHDENLTAAFINCRWFQSTVPESMTIQLESRGTVGSPVTVDVQNTKHASFAQEFGLNSPVICVRPLFGPFSDPTSLLQFISYYSVNGIFNYVFFNYAIDPKVIALLSEINFVKIKVLPWNLDPITASSVHATGQIASINYCIKSFPLNPIIFVDIDEFIVVGTADRINKNYLDTNQDSDRDTLSSHIFRSMAANGDLVAEIMPMVLVCDQNNDLLVTGNSTSIEKSSLGQNTSIASSIVSRFKIVNYSKRQASFYPYDTRTKMIVYRPHLVKTLGIHAVHELKYQKSSLFSSVEQVRQSTELSLYHYRSCCGLTQFYFNWFLRIPYVLSYVSLSDNVISDYSLVNFKIKLLNFIQAQNFSNSH